MDEMLDAIERRRASQLKWRQAHKEHLAVYNKEWRKKHPEKVKEYGMRKANKKVSNTDIAKVAALFKNKEAAGHFLWIVNNKKKK